MVPVGLLSPVILLPAHPASFAHKFLFQRVPGCNNIADLSLKIVFWTLKFAVGILKTASPRTHKLKIVNGSLPTLIFLSLP